MQSFRGAPLCLAVLVFALLVGRVSAQVPQNTTFTGRLVDDTGTPLAGPQDLELRIFDVELGGTPLYSEEHLSVSLDATGGFSVQLGLGANPSGTFDADLFSEVDRWLEVVVAGEVLTPRQIIASVPWALVAQQANEIVRDPNGPLRDCGDGTVADPKTGLQWEQKTGTVGPGPNCEVVSCPDPHDVNNFYRWSDTGTGNPDGGAFTDFLAKLNDQTFGIAISPSDPTGCFAGHCDWRLPNIAELQTILDCSSPTQCVDPIFGPTGSSYWSASKSNPSTAYYVEFFFGGNVVSASTFDTFQVRAVRAGSCD